MFKTFIATVGAAFLLGCNLPTVPDTPQTWLLVNEAGQTATVSVSPFTNSGSFGETSDSEGWWVEVPGCRFRLIVGGNISHTSRGDHWTFVNFGGSGCKSQALGQAEGTADASFPDATYVSNGTLWLRYESPTDDVVFNSTWTAVRIS